MTKVILTVGAQASGKSTWARQYCLEHGAFQVERDQIRLDNYLPFGTDENRVTDIQRSIIHAVLRAGQDVVMSDMNLSPKNRRSFLQWLKEKCPGTEVEYKLFTDVPLDVLIERNAQRPPATFIPPSVIHRLHTELIETHKFIKDIPLERIIT